MKLENDVLISWFKSHIDINIKSISEVVKTPYSLVLKIESETIPYYLKQTPEDLFIEAATLELLSQECGIKTIPVMIAKSEDLKCFATVGCGDETLRSFFKGTLDKETLKRGILCYQDIQNATSSFLDLFLAAGLPDWRLNKFPDLYKGVLNDQDFMNFLELTNVEKNRLENKNDKLESLCAKIDELNIQDTLNHADFQNNNIVIDHKSRSLSVIDWGEAYIGNPLLSRYYCINSAKYVYRLSDDSPEYSFLEECVFEFNHKAPNVIKESIKDLYPIIHTLAWHRLIKATDYNVHYARRDRVRTILLSFAEE